MKAGEHWQVTLGMDIEGKTLGILGLGKLGARAAGVGKAFGMKVIAWSQNLTPERCKEVGAEYVSKDDLFRNSDFVTIHLQLSERTRGLVTANELGLMKKTAYIINTSRGPIVDEKALLDALRSKQIAGAGLDVFDVEPLPLDHPFRKLDNVGDHASPRLCQPAELRSAIIPTSWRTSAAGWTASRCASSRKITPRICMRGGHSQLQGAHDNAELQVGDLSIRQRPARRRGGGRQAVRCGRADAQGGLCERCSTSSTTGQSAQGHAAQGRRGGRKEQAQEPAGRQGQAARAGAVAVGDLLRRRQLHRPHDGDGEAAGHAAGARSARGRPEAVALHQGVAHGDRRQGRP